jgi:hypothetical protein
MIYSTYLAWKKSPWYWLAVGLSFSLLIQLHYLTLLALGGSGLIWLLQLSEYIKGKTSPLRSVKFRQFILGTLGAVLIFVVSLTPLLLFDSRHGWLNAQAFSKLFTQEEAFVTRETSGITEKIVNTVFETHGRSLHILFEITLGQHRVINTLLLVLVIGIWFLLLRQKQNQYRPGHIVISSFLVTGIIGTSLYEHTVFDHYIAYLFPVTFLVFGTGLAWLLQKRSTMLLAMVFMIAYSVINIRNLPLSGNSWNIFQMQTVTESIHQRLSENEPYSLVLLSPSGDLYGQNYRYFLSTTSTPALPPEQAGEATTLVVINEEHTPNVADLPIYEIVTFSEKKLSEVYTIDNGPEVLIFRKQ